jgi:hypothetical protein
MPISNFSKARNIPTKTTTKKTSPTTTNFAKGIYTYKPNDTMDLDEVYLAQNARFDRIGEYQTRTGLQSLCEPIGKTVDTNTYDLNYNMQKVEKTSLSISTSVPIYSLNLTVAASNSTDYGVLQATLLDEDDEVVAISCVKDLTTTPTDTEFVFKEAPTGDLTLKLSTQGIANQKFLVACPTGTTPMYKLNTATAGYITNIFEANINDQKSILFTFKESTGGTTTLYRQAPNGTVSLIRTLPSGVEKVRFQQNINKIRYVDGKESPRIIDPSNSWADTAISTIDLKTDVNLNIKTSNILDGTQDNIMYFDADTTTQAVWTYPYGFEYAPAADFTTSATLNAYVPASTTTTTIQKSTLTPVSDTYPVSSLATGDIIQDDGGNYGQVSSISGDNITVTSISHVATAINSYDKFDRDFRQNFPAIETGDPLTAMFNLGGVIYMLTRRNKYYIYYQTADVWNQQASSAQHGTFSQESCVCDLNYAYYATDDGIFVFDGSSEESITEKTIQKTYDAIQGKDSITMDLYNNRLYVFYSSNGNGVNDSCLVFNTNLRLWESFDTGTIVSATCGRKSTSNRFICGSSKFGQLFLYEDDSNAYADLGSPIDFDIETAYMHFGTPSQLHRITKWRPEFSTVANSYTIKCGYALDFTDNVEYAFSINLKNNTPVQESYVWDNPPAYGNIVTPTMLTMTPQVNGQFRRCQIRYQHHAAYEPINFKAHTLSVEIQRLR